MERRQIYLDYNATSPLRDNAREFLIAALSAANPSSVHSAGRDARMHVEQSRASVARAAGVKPAQVIFTSGATESNALAISGIASKRILVAATEHDSVLANAPTAEKISVSPAGIIDLEALERRLQEQSGAALVCVMAVNNESGVIQPISDIAKMTKQYGALLHVDAAQALARININMSEWGADTISLSAHKAGGPKGIGALIARENLPIAPHIKGGGQEQNRRAGTENVAAIAGFGAVAEQAEFLLQEHQNLKALQQYLETELAEINGVTIYGQQAARACNTTLLTLQGVPSATQLMNLDLAGFAVSSGSACSSGKVKPSHVLTAMGVDADLAATSLRISSGWQTSKADIAAFADVFRQMARRLAKS